MWILGPEVAWSATGIGPLPWLVEDLLTIAG